MRRVLKNRNFRLAAAVGVLALLATACARGSYAVDIFPEMHYQQSYRVQEPPRRYPAEGSVPVTGREVVPPASEAKTLKMPTTADITVARGKELYRWNCAFCHGPTGLGDGLVGDKLAANGYIHPPNLTVSATQSKADGELFLIMTNGVNVMPKFGLLLNEQDRWSLVMYLRSIQAK